MLWYCRGGPGFIWTRSRRTTSDTKVNVVMGHMPLLLKATLLLNHQFGDVEVKLYTSCYIWLSMQCNA